MPSEPSLDGFAIRAAIASDAVPLAELGRKTFIDKFGHIYSAADLNAYLDEAHTETVYAEMIDNPDFLVRVAELPGGQLAAYLVCSPLELPAEKAEPGSLELMRVYVDEPLQGRGLGSHFVKEALDWASISGAPEFYLSVFSENDRARKLYERFGFEKVGEFDFPVGEHRDRELLMRRVMD